MRSEIIESAVKRVARWPKWKRDSFRMLEEHQQCYDEWRTSHMPYIKSEERKNDLTNIHAVAENPGELNYQITLLFIDYINAHGLNYQHINDVVGAGLGAVAEFQRRVVGAYEDVKIGENGDVYPDSFPNPSHQGVVILK